MCPAPGGTAAAPGPACHARSDAMTNHLEAGGAEHRDRPDPHLSAMHRTPEQLDAGLDAIRASPRDDGTLDWITCRPANGERIVLETATLDVAGGLVGDNWATRPTKR